MTPHTPSLEELRESTAKARGLTVRQIAAVLVQNAVPRAGVRDTNSECPRYNETLPDGRHVKAHTKRELYLKAVSAMEDSMICGRVSVAASPGTPFAHNLKGEI